MSNEQSLEEIAFEASRTLRRNFGMITYKGLGIREKEKYILETQAIAEHIRKTEVEPLIEVLTLLANRYGPRPPYNFDDVDSKLWLVVAKAITAYQATKETK